MSPLISILGILPECGPLFSSRIQFVRLLLLLVAVVFIQQFAGCSEGPLWRTGKYNPWVRDKWAEEEKIADTLFSRKSRMENVVRNAVNGPIDVQEEAALALSDIIFRDKVLLMRLHAVRLLGQLKGSPSAVETLTRASKDNDRDIRLAAIESWKTLGTEAAVPQLQEIIGSDTDIDVRLAATEALGSFPGRASVTALAMSLNDRNPALQVRAAESLQKVTGESLGRNIVAWQDYVKNVSPQPLATTTAIADADFAPPSGGYQPNPTGLTERLTERLTDERNAIGGSGIR